MAGRPKVFKHSAQTRSKISAAHMGKKNPKITTHGLTNTSIYSVWCSMKQRCYNPKWKDFQPLRECPFCGGEAELYGVPHIPKGWDFIPRCKTTSCCGRQAKKYSSREVAIAAWNRRAQPSEKPLTLEELRGMDGEPIWIKEFPPYAFAGYKVLSLRVVDVYGDIVCEDGDIYDYERYGKTWLAYRRKPKEEA